MIDPPLLSLFQAPADSGQVVTGLVLACVLGLVIVAVYRAAVPSRIASPALQGAIVLLAMVAAMVMMVIGNSLARAFSLVGALAVVRFRTGLKSPWDITFVFFALAAGIACGVLAWNVAIVGTSVVGLAVLVVGFFTAGGRGDVQVLRCDFAAYEGTEARMLDVLDKHVRQRSLIEARSLRFGETLSLRYRIIMNDPRRLEPLLRELSGVEGMERVVVYTDEEQAQQD